MSGVDRVAGDALQRPLHREGPAGVTEGSRLQIDPAQSGHCSVEVTLGSPSTGRFWPDSYSGAELANRTHRMLRADASTAAWLHQLTAVTAGEDMLAGHGVRGGKAMIATLRWRLIAVPGRLIRHARHLVLRLPPGHWVLPEVLARLRALPVPA